jgi:surface protein
MWDLTGLKLNDFHTFGMNNWVKPSEDSYIKIANNTELVHAQGNVTRDAVLGSMNLTEPNNYKSRGIGVFKLKAGSYKFTTSNNTSMTIRYSETIDGIQSFSGGGTNSGGVHNYSKDMYFCIHLDNAVEWLQINDIRFVLSEIRELKLSGNFNLLDHTTVVEELSSYLKLDEVKSITMPQRMSGYSVRMVNADITPINYATHLYPLLVDTTLPITGKLDYTKYQGTSLAWAYAYVTSDVSINPLDSRSQGNITNSYNKLYGTDYVDIVDVWVYKDTDVSAFSTNNNITKAYIELTSTNFETRIDEVLQYYPNCGDIYLFDDGSVTSLNYLYSGGGHNNAHGTKKQVKYVTFMDGYFNNIKYFNVVFYCCENLETVNNIPKSITEMKETFHGCSKLNQHFDFSGYNIINNGFDSTFYGCLSLTYAPIFPSNYTGTMKNCFYDCKSLTTASVIPDGVNYMYETFKNCISLTTAPTIPSSVTNLAGTFHSCTSLITPPTILSSKANMQNTFNGCKSLTTAPVIPNGIADVRNCFENCTSLTQVPVIPSSVTSVDYAFRGCKALTTVDTTNWDTRNITSLNGLFYGCSNLIAINGIENWNTSKVTNVWDLFYGCGSLTDIDLSNWDMSKMSSTGCMYRYCSSLKTAYLPIQGGIPENALHGCSSNLDIVWVGERSTDFNIGVYSHSGFRKEDIQELVPEHLADFYKDKIKISFSNKTITINDTDTTWE